MSKYLNPAESKKRWQEREAPPGYVAGLGRGAVGFTTRSDLGDSYSSSYMNEIDAANAADDEDAGLFASGRFDKEDDEADQVFASVDAYMDNRRKRRREQREAEEASKMQKERPKIQAQFADAKAELSKVSFDEWNSIEDPGNYSRAKKQKTDHITAAPDSLLTQTRAQQQLATAVTDTEQTPLSGIFTPSMQSVSDLTKVGQAKQTIMRAKLEAASDSVTGQTSINPKGYLTDLAQTKIASAAEVGDKKRARLLLDSVLETHPKHGPAWIARARLEEADGKIARARKFIKEATEVVPNSVDVWLEASRLLEGREGQEILAEAVTKLPKAVPLWLAAARMETDPARQKRVLRKALEEIPNSVKLWRAAVQLESPEDAKKMLEHAVECVPSSVEMWLALAHLEDYEGAKKVLNRARSAIPTEKSIWLNAAKLEEAHGSPASVVRQVIRKAIKSLSAHGVVIDRDMWLREAEACEQSGSIATCQAVILETIGLGVEDEDRKKTWVEDAEQSLQRGAIHTARAIYAHATAVFPGKKSLWLRMADLERVHGTPESLREVLAKSVKYCINSEVLWLMYAKTLWTQGDVDGAREVLKQAFIANPDNEAIWLAAVKLEKENGHYDLARSVLERARATAATARVWMKSALLERELGRDDEQEKLLLEGLSKFKNFAKLYLMLAQLYIKQGKEVDAKKIYWDGVENTQPPSAVPVWIGLARLEEATAGAGRARAILEKGRHRCPATPELWLESIRLERRTGQPRIAHNMMAKALQECPKSGLLWAERIAMESRPSKKAASIDALKRCDQDPHVVLAVAQLFHQNRQIEKARVWYQRTITLDPDFGDGWAAAYQFEMEQGVPEQQEALLKRCVEAEPHHGERWIAVSKDITRKEKLSTEQILKLVAASYAGIYNIDADVMEQ